MHFVVYGIDAPGKLATRLAVRPEDVAYLATSQHKMLVTGPCFAPTGR